MSGVISDCGPTGTECNDTGATGGGLTKIGSGTLTLTNANTYTGPTTIDDDTLLINGSITSATRVNSGGILGGIGTIFGDVANAGTIAPGDPGVNNGIGTLTINGNYTSDGGALDIETVLGNDSSLTDLLVITGNTIEGSGQTQVFVTNLGGEGGETTGDGIKIIQVDGTSTADLFALGAPAIGGEYVYNLFQGGDGDWYLRDDGLAPTVPTHGAYAAMLLGLAEMPTLQQRVGNRYYGLAGGGGADLPTVEEQAIESLGYTGGRNLWTRIEAAHRHVEGDSITGAEYDVTRYLAQLGLDGMLADNGAGIVIGGINAQYARGEAEISSDLGDGDNSTDSYGVGATLTWYGDNGTYVDGQAMVAYLVSDLSSDDTGDLVDDNDGWGYALSVEVGRKIGLGGNWGITPQAQLAYTSVDFDDWITTFSSYPAHSRANPRVKPEEESRATGSSVCRPWVPASEVGCCRLRTIRSEHG